MKDLINLILREKPVRIILSLLKEDTYLTRVSKETDCTYSHTVKVLNELKKHGLVEFKKEGRINKVNLTEKGKEIAILLKNLIKKLE